MPRHLKAALPPLVALHFYPGRKKRECDIVPVLCWTVKGIWISKLRTHTLPSRMFLCPLSVSVPVSKFLFSVEGEFPLFIFPRHNFYATMANKRGCMLYIALNHCSPCILVTNSNYGVNMLYLASHLWHHYGIPKRNWMAGYEPTQRKLFRQ